MFISSMLSYQIGLDMDWIKSAGWWSEPIMYDAELNRFQIYQIESVTRSKIIIDLSRNDIGLDRIDLRPDWNQFFLKKIIKYVKILNISIMLIVDWFITYLINICMYIICILSIIVVWNRSYTNSVTGFKRARSKWF